MRRPLPPPREWREERAMPLIQFAIPSPCSAACLKCQWMWGGICITNSFATVFLFSQPLFNLILFYLVSLYLIMNSTRTTQNFSTESGTGGIGSAFWGLSTTYERRPPPLMCFSPYLTSLSSSVRSRLSIPRARLMSSVAAAAAAYRKRSKSLTTVV